MNSTPPAAGSPQSHPLVSRLFLAAALLVNLWLATRHWNESLLDGHEFRQVQTAISAYYAREDGFKLAYDTPLLGPPWAVPMEFPTYQWLVAGLSKFTGLHLEQSGRLISLLSFYAALPAIWLLLRRWGCSPTIRNLAVASVLTCPVLTFYSRTFLIEGTALALCCWFLWTYWRSLDEGALRWLPLTWLFGALAALTKVTTFAVFCFPAGLAALAATFEWREGRPALRSWRPAVMAAAGLLVPMIAAVAWVRYTDQVKLLNPYGSFLTSATLHDWNWGTLTQRFEGQFWGAIYRTTSSGVMSEPALLLLLGALPGLSRSARWRTATCIALFFTGCLLFANLYFVHDYYSYATAAFLAVALGVATGSLLEEGRLPARIALTLFALALISQVAIFWRGYGGFYRRPNQPPPPFAEIIRRTTAPADVLIAFGLDWNGVIPYHAHRRALMVPHHKLDDREAFKQAVAGFGDLRPGALIIAGTLRNSPEFVVPRLRQFGMEGFPIASTNDMDLYLRVDLHERARQDLKGNNYPGVVFQLEPAPPHLDENTATSLTVAPWAGRFRMWGPEPYAYRSPFQPVIDALGGAVIVRTHAPMEFLFHPPEGANRIEATGALIPEAYTNGNVTDGVILQVFEEQANGRRVLLTERELKPMTRPDDRTEVTLRYTNTQPFRGTIVLRVDPGPMGVINCDWGYWKSVRIY